MSILEAGTEVTIWEGIRLMFEYPKRGVVKQYIPDYPGGPTYEVAFAEGDIPSACLKPEWVFRSSASSSAPSSDEPASQDP